MAKLIYRVNKQTGAAMLTVAGVAGRKCLGVVSNEVLKQLGKVVSDEPTAEMHLAEEDGPTTCQEV